MQTTILPNKPVSLEDAHKAINIVWQISKGLDTSNPFPDWEELRSEIDGVCNQYKDNGYLWAMCYGLLDYFEAIYLEARKNEKR